jgi:hypothetical protein
MLRLSSKWDCNPTQRYMVRFAKRLIGVNRCVAMFYYYSFEEREKLINWLINSQIPKFGG